MFACLYIPDFPAAAILRCEPDLRGRSVAVLTGHPPLEKVVALNERARQIGVEIGATKAQVEAWEELVLRTQSEAQEASAHAALLECAQSFSPEIEDTTPDTVLLNLAGLESLFGPFSKIAEELAQRAAQMDLAANVAVASNPDAALLAAHGFSGVTLIPEGHEVERLGELPVDVLLECFSSDPDEAANWLEIFDRWGIRNLRALAGLPEISLSERLGQQGVRLRKLAQGALRRDLRRFEAATVFEETVELEFPIVMLEPLAFLLNRMMEKVCARLGSRARAAQELRLTLELDIPPGLQPTSLEDANAGFKARSFTGVLPQSSTNMSSLVSTNVLSREEGPTDPATHPCSTFTRTLRLPVPMLDAKVILKLLQLDLLAHPPGAPIRKIHLVAEPARPRSTQSGLFLPVFPEPEKLGLTLARISGIVGEGRAGAAELLDTHREGAFEMRPFAPTQQEEKKVKKDGAVQVEDDGSDRMEVDAQERAQEKMTAVIALRLFRPRLRAVVNVCEGKPVKLKCLVRKDIRGEIVWTAGPWRSSGDWSEQEGWAREEWDIAMQIENEIVLYRLVEDRLMRQWWVEGMYD